MKESISTEDLTRFADGLADDPTYRLSLNAVTENGVRAVAMRRTSVAAADSTFSHRVKTPEATNQKKSGRCWLFAAMNTLRLSIMERLRLKDFQLSGAWLMFWDKLEKSNWFLESIIETREEPLDGRLVMWLMQDPVGDGGQWDMFVSLVEKYGLVPQEAMPESYSSSNSRAMNSFLVEKLREYARDLRSMAEGGADGDGLRAEKDRMMATVYRMLCVHLGVPPESFVWQWRDKDDDFHRHGQITPRGFAEEYVEMDLDSMVCLINAPTDDKPFGRLYTVRYLGNVSGGRQVRYLNVPMDVLREAAVEMLRDGRPVWFGCDVGKMGDRKKGLLDMAIFDLECVYGEAMTMSKADRLDYGHSRMTHAMVLTGVDIDESGDPVRWDIENSWGKDSGRKGHLTMTDEWFEEYLYEVTVDVDYLPEEYRAALKTRPTVLPPWDPMGSLAR